MLEVVSLSIMAMARIMLALLVVWKGIAAAATVDYGYGSDMDFQTAGNVYSSHSAPGGRFGEPSLDVEEQSSHRGSPPMTIFSSHNRPGVVHNQSQVHSLDLTIGFLVSSESEYAHTVGAIRISIDRIQNEKLLPKATWNFTWQIDSCNESVATDFLIRSMKHRKIQMMLEPTCYASAIVSAVIAKRYAIPVIGWASNPVQLMDSNRFPGRISIVESPAKIAEALIEFLKHSKWYRVAKFYSSNPDRRQCQDAMHMFYRMQAPGGILTAFEAAVHEPELVDSDITDFLDNMSAVARTSVLCFESSKQMRAFMNMAHRRGMATDEYTYVILQLTDDDDGAVDEPNMARVEPAFQRVVLIQADTGDADSMDFRRTVIGNVREGPSHYQGGHDGPEMANLHDAMYLYAMALNRTLARHGPIFDARDVIRNARRVSFKGKSGTVHMDDEGIRRRKYSITGFDRSTREVRIGEIDLSALGEPVKLTAIGMNLLESLSSNGHRCGLNETCSGGGQEAFTWKAIGISCALVFGSLFVACLVCMVQKKVISGEAGGASWTLGYSEIFWINDRSRLSSTLLTLVSFGDDLDPVEGDGNGNPKVVRCRGSLAWAREHDKVPNWSGRLDAWMLRTMANLSHDNVNTFIGLCVELHCPISVWGFNSKGSLDEVIKNERNRLDMVFKYSLMKDLASGMEYLCSTPVKSHGRLRSSNCVVDNRWTLKVTDYGLHSLRVPWTDPADMLWTAPEFLRMDKPPVAGNEKGDVYSFSIILQELFDLEKPYWRESLPAEEIIFRVRTAEAPPFRPALHSSTTDEGTWNIMRLIAECWEEDPQQRPPFRRIKQILKEMRRGGASSLMDYVMKTSEKYASGLEEMVQEKMRQLAEEKKRTDELVCRLLPKVVAERLRNGLQVEGEFFECASVLFSDVVGFTKLAAGSTPMQTVTLLNCLYTAFDDIIALYDAYKVVTIGDGYFCTSGLPIRNGNRHASELAELALHVISAINTFRIPHRPDDRLEVRIGIHTGPAVAGIVGTIMPRYCVFGDTVNTANRMEATGQPSCIHISDVTNEFLTKTIGGFVTEPRGEVIIKGRGVIFTYWLVGKTGKNQVHIRKAVGDARYTIVVTHDGSASGEQSAAMPLVEAE